MKVKDRKIIGILVLEMYWERDGRELYNCDINSSCLIL